MRGLMDTSQSFNSNISKYTQANPCSDYWSADIKIGDGPNAKVMSLSKVIKIVAEEAKVCNATPSEITTAIQSLKAKAPNVKLSSQRSVARQFRKFSDMGIRSKHSNTTEDHQMTFEAFKARLELHEDPRKVLDDIAKYMDNQANFSQETSIPDDLLIDVLCLANKQMDVKIYTGVDQYSKRQKGQALTKIADILSHLPDTHNIFTHDDSKSLLLFSSVLAHQLNKGVPSSDLLIKNLIRVLNANVSKLVQENFDMALEQSETAEPKYTMTAEQLTHLEENLRKADALLDIPQGTFTDVLSNITQARNTFSENVNATVKASHDTEKISDQDLTHENVVDSVKLVATMRKLASSPFAWTESKKPTAAMSENELSIAFTHCYAMAANLAAREWNLFYGASTGKIFSSESTSESFTLLSKELNKCPEKKDLYGQKSNPLIHSSLEKLLRFKLDETKKVQSPSLYYYSPSSVVSRTATLENVLKNTGVVTGSIPPKTEVHNPTFDEFQAKINGRVSGQDKLTVFELQGLLRDLNDNWDTWDKEIKKDLQFQKACFSFVLGMASQTSSDLAYEVFKKMEPDLNSRIKIVNSTKSPLVGTFRLCYRPEEVGDNLKVFHKQILAELSTEKLDNDQSTQLQKYLNKIYPMYPDLVVGTLEKIEPDFSKRVVMARKYLRLGRADRWFTSMLRYETDLILLLFTNERNRIQGLMNTEKQTAQQAFTKELKASKSVLKRSLKGERVYWASWSTKNSLPKVRDDVHALAAELKTL